MTAHARNAIVLLDKVHHLQTGPRPVPLQEPHGPCYIRYEIAPGKIYISLQALKQFCLALPVSYRWLEVSLIKQGVFTGAIGRRTLNLGSNAPGAPTLSIEVDATHAAVLGATHEASLHPTVLGVKSSPAKRTKP
jgi:hypothetical protein